MALAVITSTASWRSIPPRSASSTLSPKATICWARRLRERPYGRVIAAFVTEAQTDPAFEEQYRTRFVEPRREQGRAAFARAAARGEIPTGINVELALDMLYGPVYHRLLHRHAPLTDRFVGEVVDAVLRGLAD